jgi:type II secretory pathway pseudopilin PulG
LTLTELLAVIAIIGLLAGLLLPAVQAAREAGRRATCSNNLLQLGRAIGSYEAANGHFPPGAYGASAYSWIVMILPQLEQQATYGKLARLQGTPLLWTSKDLQSIGYPEVAGFYSSTLVCPTNPLPVRTTVSRQHIISSYIAVAGASDAAFKSVDATTSQFSSSGSPSFDRCPNDPRWSGFCYNGLMSVPWREGRNDKLADGTPDLSKCQPGTLFWFFNFPNDATVTGCRPGQVRDGLSNCLLLGEQTDWGWLTFAGQPPVRGFCNSGASGWVVGRYQPGDTGGQRSHNLTAVNKPLGSRFCDQPEMSGSQPYSSLDNQIGFFSAHGPGATFVFGDGAVRWLDETIDFNLYQRLAIRDTASGGPTLPPPVGGGPNVKVLP